MRSNNCVIFSLLLSINICAFGMEEIPNISKRDTKKTLNQAQENSKTKKYAYNVYEQQRILKLSKDVDSMSLEDTNTFIKSIENTSKQDPEYSTIIKQVCCLKNIYAPKNRNDLGVEKSEDFDSLYYTTITGEFGNWTFNIYHAKLPKIPIHSLNFNAVEIEECTVQSNYIKAMVKYDWCTTTQCVWKIPTFEQYLKSKKQKPQNRSIISITKSLLPIKPLLASIAALQRFSLVQH